MSTPRAVTGTVRRMPKGTGYLTDKWASSPQKRLRFQRRGDVPPVNPAFRIRDWNIRPGDQVRLMVGSDAHKYVNEAEGKASGYRIWTVNRVDVRSNTVQLDGFKAAVNPSDYADRPLPEGSRYWTDAQRKTYQKGGRPKRSKYATVHYSNLQLLVEENGIDSVFATRLATSAPVFDPKTGKMEYERYAASLSGPSSRDIDPVKGKIHLPWPAYEPEPHPPAGPDDTLSPATRSFSAPTAEYLASSSRAASVIPSSLLAPAPIDQSLPERYISEPDARSDPALDVLMPLFLSEELGPRFSRAKRTQAYNDRRVVLERERTTAIRSAVKKWEANGRDKDLAVALAAANLEGLSIRGRTRAEVREMAAAQFDEAQDLARRAPRDAARMEMSWDAEQGVWVPGEKIERAQKKRAGKLAKQVWKAKKMDELKLKPGRNMVVPPEARL